MVGKQRKDNEVESILKLGDVMRVTDKQQMNSALKGWSWEFENTGDKEKPLEVTGIHIFHIQKGVKEVDLVLEGDCLSDSYMQMMRAKEKQSEQTQERLQKIRETLAKESIINGCKVNVNTEKQLNFVCDKPYSILSRKADMSSIQNKTTGLLKMKPNPKDEVALLMEVGVGVLSGIVTTDTEVFNKMSDNLGILCGVELRENGEVVQCRDEKLSQLANYIFAQCVNVMEIAKERKALGGRTDNEYRMLLYLFWISIVDSIEHYRKVYLMSDDFIRAKDYLTVDTTIVTAYKAMEENCKKEGWVKEVTNDSDFQKYFINKLREGKESGVLITYGQG